MLVWILFYFIDLHIFLCQYHAIFTNMAIVLFWNQVWWGFHKNVFVRNFLGQPMSLAFQCIFRHLFPHYLWRMSLAYWLGLYWLCSMLLVGWLFSQYWFFQTICFGEAMSLHLLRPSLISSFYIHLKVFYRVFSIPWLGFCSEISYFYLLICWLVIHSYFQAYMNERKPISEISLSEVIIQS